MSRISDASGAVDEIRKGTVRKKACPAARFLGHGVNNDMTVIKRMESYRFEEILQRGDTSRVSPLFVSWVTRISRKMAFAKGNCECMGGKMLKRQPISKNQNPDLGIAKAEWRKLCQFLQEQAWLWSHQ